MQTRKLTSEDYYQILTQTTEETAILNTLKEIQLAFPEFAEFINQMHIRIKPTDKCSATFELKKKKGLVWNIDPANAFHPYLAQSLVHDLHFCPYFAHWKNVNNAVVSILTETPSLKTSFSFVRIKLKKTSEASVRTSLQNDVLTVTVSPTMAVDPYLENIIAHDLIRTFTRFALKK